MKTKLETQVETFFNMIKDNEYYSKASLDSVLLGRTDSFGREIKPESSKVAEVDFSFIMIEGIGARHKFYESELLTEEEKDQYIKERLDFFKANAEKFTGGK